MNLDLGSFAFGSYLQMGAGTPSWGTALGQSKPDYKFTYPGAETLLVGVLYCSVPLERVSLPLGKGGRIYKASELEECQVASLFRKVYINGRRIDYPFVMVLIKESSDSHAGRKSIKYSDKNTYEFGTENYSNQEFIRQARISLGLSENACWFVYAIEVYNQDELHMFAVIVDKDNSVTYRNSSERRNSWIDLIPEKNISHLGEQIRFADVHRNLQQIYYGAPGTGKSHEIKEQTEGKQVIRTTFHPDSDYSTFVGAYKPTTVDEPLMTVIGTKAVPVENEDGTLRTESKIIYEFVEQAFLQAYIKAWKQYTKATAEGKDAEEVYLVIEEINRGNCAQIFGDLFQLLDRGENGFSEYPINADNDLRKHLDKAFEGLFFDVPAIGGMSAEKVGAKLRSGEILLLPSNLYIWATMNTSDQSLFPIDSAFKRRWDWVYMPISDAKKNYVIEIDNDQYDWWSFLTVINTIIESTTHSEDKKLGYFFAKAKDNKITADVFVGKIIFYLWNDVFKDNETNHKAFKDENGEMLAFHRFFHEDGSVNTDVVIKFLQDLEVYPFEVPDDGTSVSSTTVPAGLPKQA